MKLLAITSIRIDNNSGIILNKLCTNIKEYLTQCKKDIENIPLSDQ